MDNKIKVRNLKISSYLFYKGIDFSGFDKDGNFTIFHFEDTKEVTDLIEGYEDSEYSKMVEAYIRAKNVAKNV